MHRNAGCWSRSGPELLCHHIQGCVIIVLTEGFTIVCDAGVHPAHTGLTALPFIDNLDWSTVDALLITHFHLDHAAALTYIMEKTNFCDGKGKVYMTHPTKALSLIHI